MPSITTWNRLEPRARSVDFAESLAARVHDPLWFLARQWQLQEFRGEDGGSAVAVHLRGVAAPITRSQSTASRTKGWDRERGYWTASPSPTSTCFASTGASRARSAFRRRRSRISPRTMTA